MSTYYAIEVSGITSHVDANNTYWRIDSDLYQSDTGYYFELVELGPFKWELKTASGTVIFESNQYGAPEPLTDFVFTPYGTGAGDIQLVIPTAIEINSVLDLECIALDEQLKEADYILMSDLNFSWTTSCPTWSSGTLYNRGTVVVYSSTFYYCTVTNSDTANPSTSYKWMMIGESGQYTKGWLGIGSLGGSGTPFSGTFNGNGKTISNLRQSAATRDSGARNSGLFGYCYSASIKNLIFQNATIYDPGFAGLVSSSTVGCSIENIESYSCVVQSTNLGGRAGGIVGSSDSTTITKCFCYSSNTSSLLDYGRGGGISSSAENSTVISKCYVYSGSVSGYYAGSIIGLMTNTSHIIDCYGTYNSVSGVSAQGGIAGSATNSSTIKNCYFRGQLSGSASNKKPIQGTGTELITNCFYDSDIVNASGNGTPLTTAQMKDITNFADAEWDVSTIWNQSSLINNGYLYLDPRTGFLVGENSISSDIFGDNFMESNSIMNDNSSIF